MLISSRRSKLTLVAWRQVLPLVVLLLAGVLWEAVARWGEVPPVILPPLSNVLTALLADSPEILRETGVTLRRVALGFALGTAAGTLLGVLIGMSTIAYSVLYPLLIAFYAVPKQALVPLLVLWVGFGTPPAVITALLTSFFPILVNVATGVRSVDPDLHDLVSVSGGTRFDTIWMIALPGAAPYFFSGLRVGVVGALVGVTLSEMTAAQSGLGYRIMMTTTTFRISSLFAYVLVAALLGMLLYAIVILADRRAAWWAYRASDGQSY